ncbi:hypothetical protein QM306_40230, partial [Burkholderia cenocepacia]|nr:hypothetical protein [Burkholderia cenocepacia]
ARRDAALRARRPPRAPSNLQDGVANTQAWRVRRPCGVRALSQKNERAARIGTIAALRLLRRITARQPHCRGHPTLQ